MNDRKFAIWQVPATRHPLLAALLELLKNEAPPAGARPIGDFLPYLTTYPPAEHSEASQLFGTYLGHLKEPATMALRAHGVDGDVRTINYYPPGGGVGWHTNANEPGWRVYTVRATGRSAVGTAEEDVLDRDGYANIFEITGPTSWHCVKAWDARWSIGIRVKEEWVKELLR